MGDADALSRSGTDTAIRPPVIGPMRPLRQLRRAVRSAADAAMEVRAPALVDAAAFAPLPVGRAALRLVGELQHCAPPHPHTPDPRPRPRSSPRAPGRRGVPFSPSIRLGRMG